MTMLRGYVTLGWILTCLVALGLSRNVCAQPPADTQRTPDDPQVAAELAAIAKVGPEGKGSVEAKAAREALAGRGIEILPQLLVAMDTPNSVAGNWYRSVYEEIVSRAKTKPDAQWPIEFFKAYINDAKRNGRPRRLVLDLIDQLEPNFSQTWKPTRLSDPAFRYDAVNLALAAGDRALAASDKHAASDQFRKAFENARDSAQVLQAATKLQSLGEPADAVKHLGLVTDWWLVGPFDAPQKTGFSKTFEPERTVDLQAKYPGQGDTQIAWLKHHATDSLGQVNLIQAIATTREAVGYAYTEIDLEADTSALLGCGADDNCLVWLDGEKVLAREQWLNGTRFDRFVVPIKLKAGRNKLLVKVCQGPQHKDPEVSNNWSLQLRICDADGKGIPFKSALDK